MDKIPRHLCASLWGDEEFEWRESPAKISVDYFAFGIKKSWWTMLHLLGRATWECKEFGNKVIFHAS